MTKSIYTALDVEELIDGCIAGNAVARTVLVWAFMRMQAVSTPSALSPGRQCRHCNWSQHAPMHQTDFFPGHRFEPIRCKTCGSPMGQGPHAEGAYSHPFEPDSLDDPLPEPPATDPELITARWPAMEMARHLLTCGDEDHVVTVLFELMQDRDNAREQLKGESQARKEAEKALQEARDHALGAIAAAARESGRAEAATKALDEVEAALRNMVDERCAILERLEAAEARVEEMMTLVAKQVSGQQ